MSSHIEGDLIYFSFVCVIRVYSLVSALIFGIVSSCLLIIGSLTVAVVVVVVAFCAIILLVFACV